MRDVWEASAVDPERFEVVLVNRLILDFLAAEGSATTLMPLRRTSSRGGTIERWRSATSPG